MTRGKRKNSKPDPNAPQGKQAQPQLNPAVALRNIELTIGRDDVTVFNFRTVKTLEASFKLLTERLAEAEELEQENEELQERVTKLERQLKVKKGPELVEPAVDDDDDDGEAYPEADE